MLKQIDHIGVAVHDLDAAIPFYRDHLGMRFLGVEEVPGYLVRVAFFEIGDAKIELLEPMSQESFLTEFLQQNRQSLHHIAYQVDDVRLAIHQLETAGVKMLDKTPRQGAHGAQVAFIHPETGRGVLTELCQPDNHQ
jgi:methylmalonyl-CoA/ethylmalonyl-CoA epimerase